MRLSFPFPGFTGFVDEDGCNLEVAFHNDMPLWAQIAIEDAWKTYGIDYAFEAAKPNAREDDDAEYHEGR